MSAMTLSAPSSPTNRPKWGRFQSFTLQPYQLDHTDVPLLASAGAGGEWESHLCFEGMETGDGREIAPGALKLRPGPSLPLMGLDQRTFGHMLARACGSIVDFERRDGTVYGAGTYGATELGQHFESLVTPGENGNSVLHTVSVDLEVKNMEWVVKGYDEDGYEEYLMRILDANLMGATIVPFPAFSRAFIAPKGGRLAKMAEAATESSYEIPGTSISQNGPIVIAASAKPSTEHPPARYFPDASKGESPGFAGVTHVRVGEPDADGWRPFAGHLADWAMPHISLAGPVYAPRSTSGYRYFLTKPLTVMGEDGPREIKIGVIAVGGGHAPKFKPDGSHYGWRLAGEFYDDPRFQGALVVTGEDRFGPWISGVVAPGATALQVKMLGRSDVSGDWRGIGGVHELVGIASVNVGAFPTIEAQAIVAAGYDMTPVDFTATYSCSATSPDGELEAIVAAGMIRRDPTEMGLADVKRRVVALERALEPFRGLGMAWLAKQMTAEALEAKIGATLADRPNGSRVSV